MAMYERGARRGLDVPDHACARLEIIAQFAIHLGRRIAFGKNAERALSLLEERLDNEDDGPRYWMQCFAARMAGEMRLEAAVPLLIAKLEQFVDADFMDEQCSRALVQIGGDDTIRAAAEIVGRDGNGVLAACQGSKRVSTICRRRRR